MISSGPTTYWFPRWAAPTRTEPNHASAPQSSTNHASSSGVTSDQTTKNLQQKPLAASTAEPTKGKAIAELDRATNYLNAVRELKEVPVHQKHSGAHEVYLDIAHYEQQPGLVDLFV